jgi:pilus assembly protein CpaC
VRVRTGITVACFCAWSVAVCVESTLEAQTPSTLPQSAQVSGRFTGRDSANDLSVVVGKSVLVDSAQPIARISVGLGDVAEATATSPSEVLVNGKTPGETSLIIWEVGGGRQFYNVTVRPSTYVANDRVEAVRRELRAELAGQDIHVNSENGLLFLRGTVKDLNSSDRAVEIASTAGKTVNLLYVDVPSAEPQILLKVHFASLDRTLTKQLGINLFSTGAANTIGSITTQQFSPPSITQGTSSTPTTAVLSDLLNIFVFRPDINLGATIKALENNGVLQVLAQPNLLASNGKQASFLAGGEYPYPVVQGVSGTTQGAITIQFKEFGVRLNFIPTITPRNTIRLQVAPEVSALDFADGLNISGFTVPALTVRKVKTDVELSDGQSFAIGGLLDNRETKTLSKIPFIGDIPVLGKFFQSIDKTRTNTELIVIVTPEIVAPIPAGAPLPELNYPDKFLPPLSGIPMTNPGANVTGAAKLSPPPPAMPIEKLIQSMQREQPLVIDSTNGGAAYASSQTAAPTSAPPASPQ